MNKIKISLGVLLLVTSGLSACSKGATNIANSYKNPDSCILGGVQAPLGCCQAVSAAAKEGLKCKQATAVSAINSTAKSFAAAASATTSSIEAANSLIGKPTTIDRKGTSLAATAGVSFTKPGAQLGTQDGNDEDLANGSGLEKFDPLFAMDPKNAGQSTGDPLERKGGGSRTPSSSTGNPGSGGGGSGGGSGGGGAGGLLAGSSSAENTKDKSLDSTSKMTAQKSSAAYAGGAAGSGINSGGKAGSEGSSLDNLFGNSENANADGISENSYDTQTADVNPMGTQDPTDYFSRIEMGESLFKKVEKKYGQKANSWATLDIKSKRKLASEEK